MPDLDKDYGLQGAELRSALVPMSDAHLPATIAAQRAQSRRRWTRIALALGTLVHGAGGGVYWWMHRQPSLPPGIAYGNGRIEADPIDIDTKFAGRILELRVDEGDMVKAGQVVAVMDTRDLATSLKKSEARSSRRRWRSPDPRQGDLHRYPGTVHTENGRNPNGA
jgi:HlyD family secretion protein